MREHNASMIKSSLLFVGGGLLGAGVALLLAPQSGVRTRRQLRRRVEDFQEDLSECLDDLVKECRTASGRGIEKGQKASRKLQEDAVKVLQASRQQINQRLEQLHHALSA